LHKSSHKGNEAGEGVDVRGPERASDPGGAGVRIGVCEGGGEMWTPTWCSAAVMAFARHPLVFFAVLRVWNGVLGLVTSNPPFLNARAHFPGLVESLEAASGKVLREYESLRLVEGAFASFEEAFGIGVNRWDKAQRGIARGDPSRGPWPVAIIRVYGRIRRRIAGLCPVTEELLAPHPEVVSVLFSTLPPDKSLTAHRGPFRGVLRLHLPILVPDERTCPQLARDQVPPAYLHCGGQTHTFQRGCCVLFDDMYVHKAVNPTTAPRTVLFMDVLRPPEAFSPWVRRLGLARAFAAANASVAHFLGRSNAVAQVLLR